MKRGEHDTDVLASAARSHQTDTPNATFQRAETAANFNLFLQQTRPHARIVYTFGNTNRVETPQSLTFSNGHSESHRFDACNQCAMIQLMTSPAGFETFFLNQSERLT